MTVLALAWAIGFAIGAAWLASQRGRLVIAWAVFGAILGPVAIVLLWVAPPGRCAHCRAPIRGWLTVCEWCGMDVRPADAAAVPATRSATAPSTRSATAAPGRDRPLISVAPTRRPGDPPAQVPPAPTPVVDGPPAPAPVADRASVVPAPKKPATPRTRKRTTKTAATGAAIQALGSAIFVTGTVGLAPGSRYTLQIEGSSLQVIGPADRSPKASAFERELDGVDANGIEGRLVISAPGTRGGTVLVFQSLDGGDTSTVARSIMDAAQKAGGRTS